MLLEARQVDCGYEQRPVLRSVDLPVAAGDFLGIIGPNGAGKSTLLRVMAGVLAPTGGTMLLLGRPLPQYHRREVARILAVVPAPSTPIFSFTVREFVTMGRTPYLGRLQSDRPEDRRIVDEALAAADGAAVAERPITEISAGEWQRVNIARALAQQPRLLLLDEPTAFLDLGHQREIFELLARLNREQGLTVVCASHDLNLAAEYCPRLAVLAEGRVYADGPPEAVVTEETVTTVYRAPVTVDRGPAGKPRVTLLSEAALAQGRGRVEWPASFAGQEAAPGALGATALPTEEQTRSEGLLPWAQGGVERQGRGRPPAVADDRPRRGPSGEGEP